MSEQSKPSFAGGECPIILASASPRRRQLLAQAGYKFTSVSSNIDESRPFQRGGDESASLAEAIEPYEYAKRLALAKAKSIAEKHPDCLVIGADTVVDFNGQIIGKPANAKEAEDITRKLFSSPHKVITAVAILRLSDGIEIVESDSTTVYPKKLTDKQIAEHIKSGSWRNKAGAYAIKETGDEFIERIEGSLTNVMGLPMELLSRLLNKLY